MSYVDLNPIRAAIAGTPESSDFTSIQQRLQLWHMTSQSRNESAVARPKLMPLVKHHRDAHQHSIGFALKDYIELVDWAGRQIRADKRGAINNATPPILQRLGLEEGAFIQYMHGRDKQHKPLFLGPIEDIHAACSRIGQRFIKGVYLSRQLYRMA